MPIYLAKKNNECKCITGRLERPTMETTYGVEDDLFVYRYKKGETERGFAVRIKFCPFCGRKLI